jgi:hypothetical protein
MKTYAGYRIDGKCHVYVVEAGKGARRRPLRLRLDLNNHSPTGFEWGYAGSGPAQLALAILADALNDDERALRLHQKFKFKVITMLDRNAPWAITDHAVLQFVREYDVEAATTES